MSALAPEHGVRVLLELVRAEPEGVVYRVELHAPRAGWSAEARIDAAGALTIGAFARLEGEGDPEPWMSDTVRAFLRTLHKNHAAQGDWPPRLLRWREPRGGTASAG